jgi:DNA topoisomerase-1
MISEHFPNIVDTGFTANMEADLDRIAAGEIPWVSKIREFYTPFADQVKLAEELMPEMNFGPEPIGRECPDCGKGLVIRWGRYGKFIACSGFPDCRHTEPWLEKIGVKCPKDGGEIAIRKTRKGRIFYGCVNYPACDFTSWKLPLPRPCPACGGLLVTATRISKCSQCRSSSAGPVNVEEPPNPGQSPNRQVLHLVGYLELDCSFDKPKQLRNLRHWSKIRTVRRETGKAHLARPFRLRILRWE